MDALMSRAHGAQELPSVLTCTDSTNVVEAWMRICPGMDGSRATQERLPKSDYLWTTDPLIILMLID